MEPLLEKFVRIVAPTSVIDFTVKLAVFLLICGGLNHARDAIQNGFADHDGFLNNFTDASFTALPMCTFALLLIGHLNSLQKQLYQHATQDSLTGLHNRRWFMDKTSHDVDGGQAMFMVDVDHFKEINDSFGHDVGDRCLQQMAQHLKSAIRKTDYCARIGGEEFAVLVHDADERGIHDVAQRISAGFVFEAGDGQTRHVTASVGVYFGQDAQPLAEALRRADKAVYHAKAQGRARYVVAPLGAENAVPMPDAMAI